MNDNEIRNLSYEVLKYVTDPKIRLWLKQVKNNYCFLRFDPMTKQMTICRWGYEKRPPNTNPLFWQRLTLGGWATKGPEWKEILTAVERWDSLWDNISFNLFESQEMPDLLPNTRFEVHNNQVKNNIFAIQN